MPGRTIMKTISRKDSWDTAAEKLWHILVFFFNPMCKVRLVSLVHTRVGSLGTKDRVPVGR